MVAPTSIDIPGKSKNKKMKQKRNRERGTQLVRDVWQLNDKHGLRSGPNSSNDAKTRGRQNTRKKPKTENRNRQRQRYAGRWRKYLPPKGKILRHYN